MILGLFSILITLSFSQFLDSVPPNSDELTPSASSIQEFVPGKIVFSTKQKAIIIFTVTICTILIIVGTIAAIKLRRKSPGTADIEKFMLPPSTSPFESMEEVEL